MDFKDRIKQKRLEHQQKVEKQFELDKLAAILRSSSKETNKTLEKIYKQLKNQ